MKENFQKIIKSILSDIRYYKAFSEKKERVAKKNISPSIHFYFLFEGVYVQSP